MNAHSTFSRRSAGHALKCAAIAAAVIVVAGCGSSPTRTKPVASGMYSFWPLAPAEPRMQFVRTFEAAADLTNQRQSALDKAIFGESRTEESAIDKPYGVEARDGLIYVCDIRRPGLTVLDLKKKQMRLVGVSGLNKLSHPVDVAVADDGEVYVADNQANAIYVYRNERYARTMGHANMKPVGLAVHGDRLYVADIEAQKIEVMNRKTGETITAFGETGDEDGQFRVPLGVDVDKEGNVYVSDMMRCRVQKFTPDGEYISGMGSLGDVAGSFARPKHMCVDSDGVIYVVDAAFQNVQMFNSNFELLMEFGASGTFPGAMNLPVGICADDSTLKYVQDMIHPGFDARRIIVVTNQFGSQVVNLYALGERNPDYALAELRSRSADIPTGLGTNPEAAQFQSQGEEPEPAPEPGEEGEAPPDDSGGGAPVAAVSPGNANSNSRPRRRGRLGGAAPRGFRFRTLMNRHATLALPLSAGVAGLAWTGCSVEKHYELLSFFFDGVPDPNALPVVGTPGNPANLRQSPTYSAHRPFLDDQCVECHGSGFSTQGVTSQVCFGCHDQISDEHERMHGPVPAGACLWCHVPHESAYAHLLKAPSRQVCTQCHDSNMLNSSRVPEHADETRQCLECHYGHGGSAAYFLRADADRGNTSPKE